RKLRHGELEDKEIEINLPEPSPQIIGSFEFSGNTPPQNLNFGEMLKGLVGGKQQRKRMTVATARAALVRDEVEKLLDTEQMAMDAVQHAENNGIVFLDEIDKVCARSTENGIRGGDISREGVQRDLLPLIEGTTVGTKYGPVRTDHVLFIASGAFHL